MAALLPAWPRSGVVSKGTPTRWTEKKIIFLPATKVLPRERSSALASWRGRWKRGQAAAKGDRRGAGAWIYLSAGDSVRKCSVFVLSVAGRRPSEATAHPAESRSRGSISTSFVSDRGRYIYGPVTRSSNPGFERSSSLDWERDQVQRVHRSAE